MASWNGFDMDLWHNYDPDYNPYTTARDEYLRDALSFLPDADLRLFEIDIVVGKTVKNAALLYTILETLPPDIYTLDKNHIQVKVMSEGVLLENEVAISDIVSMTIAWKSTAIKLNGAVIDSRMGYAYLIHFIGEKNGKYKEVRSRTINEIKKRYAKRKKAPKKHDNHVDPIAVTFKDPVQALDGILQQYINTYAGNLNVQHYEISQYDKILVIEDSLVVSFRIIPRSWSRNDDENWKDWENPYVMIQELTKNELFRFVFASFRRSIYRDSVGLQFHQFHGKGYYIDEIDHYSVVNKALPQLKLDERLRVYAGEVHHFIILRMIDINGKTVYGVGETKGAVHTFIHKICKELEEKNSASLRGNGVSCLPYVENREFIDAFLSWTGERKRWRLENKFDYCYEDIVVKHDIKLFSLPAKIIKAAQNGEFNNREYGSYTKPLNKWKSEELVYNIAKKLYGEYQVIYQYHPFFLCTEKGSMSYDVYICGLRIAIEYQGKQHFEPVEYFGGEESFEKQKARDELKLELSKKNNVKLIYVNHWEDITPSLIRTKVENALSDMSKEE